MTILKQERVCRFTNILVWMILTADPDITVCYIRDGKIVEKKHLELPEKIVNIVHCKNPRCITSVEQDLDQVFKLTDRENRVYRCAYCESKKSEY